jgi:hypothetical protein
MSVKLINEWGCVGYVVIEKLLWAHTTQGLYDASEDVLVSYYYHFLVVHDSRAYGVLPVWYHTLYSHLKRFTLW